MPKETIHKIWQQYCRDNPLVTKLISKLSTKPLDHQAVRGIENKLFQYNVTTHGVSRKIEREIKSSDIVDALKNPLKVSEIQTDIKGRISQKYIGKNVTVAINPKNKNIVSVYTTSSKLAKKLGSIE